MAMAGVFQITGSIALCFAIPAIVLWLALKFSDRNERVDQSVDRHGERDTL